MIEVYDLRVDYDDVCAVRDLTLAVGAGEIYGLIGPNGAGKTTTLRALTGLIEPTHGDILLGGVDLRDDPDQADRLVGFMPDAAPLYDDLTVWEFLDLFAASYLIPADRRTALIERTLGRVDLREKRDAMTAGLSRGMKQRLMLAKTLLPDPQVLLLDEPASGMDPHGRALLREILNQFRADRRTVMISSHILAELSDFCTSVGVMERGRMVVSGRVEEVAGQVLGRGRIAVEIVAGGDALAQVLAADERVGTVRGDGTRWEFPFDGGPEAASELLASLVAAGVKVAAFGRKKEDLEELFLRVGAKEVS
jgi:ABC-2 type transport system ATP-binding protein